MNMNVNDKRVEQEAPASERLEGQRPRERLTTADLARGAAASRGVAEGNQARSGPHADHTMPLFPAQVTEEFRGRWTDIQTGFVDTPREAVERADELVAEAIQRLAESFAEQRSRLEAEWGRSGDVSTEDLRIALQHYRSFFERLLQM